MKNIELIVKVEITDDNDKATCDITEVMEILRSHHKYVLRDKTQWCGYILDGVSSSRN